MKTNIPNIIRSIILALGTGAVLILATAAPASAAGTSIVLYLSPASATHKVGEAFNVDIRLAKNDNTFVNYVRADLTFPASILTVTSVSTAGSNFAVNAGPQYTFNQHNNTAGTIDVGGESSQVAKTGDFLVATIHFTVKATGTASVAFTNKSEAAFPINGQNILTGKTGGTYTIPATAPSPNPPPPPSPNPTPTPTPNPSTPQPSPTPNTGSTNQTTPDTNPLPPDATSASQDDVPTITNVHVSQITSTSAKITWQTDVPTTGVVQYGTSQTLLSNNVTDSNSSVSHSVPLTNLSPGKKIYYEIAASTDTTQSTHGGNFLTPSASKLASILLVGGVGLVIVVLLLLILRNMRRSPKAPIPAPATDTDKAGTAAPTPEMLASMGAPLADVPDAPDSPPLPVVDTPVASSEPTPPEAPAEQAAPMPLVPSPHPVTPPEAPGTLEATVQQLMTRTPVAPPTLPPRPSARPEFAAPPTPSPAAAPTQPAPPPMPPPLPPASSQTPVTPSSSATAPVAGPALSSTPPAPAPAADDVPDMFEEGERRLEQEEQSHTIPPA